MSELLIFTDGGSRGNPGAAAIGVFVTTKVTPDQTPEVIYQYGAYVGFATNNEAEYEAFLTSLKWLTEYLTNHQVQRVTWQLDSKLVVEQLNKNWKIKEDRLRLKAQECWQLLTALSLPYSITHIPRELNHEADRLVNQALDAQASTQ